jgi:hypothetical protein
MGLSLLVFGSAPTARRETRALPFPIGCIDLDVEILNSSDSSSVPKCIQTFHMGLCLALPRKRNQKHLSLPVLLSLLRGIACFLLGALDGQGRVRLASVKLLVLESKFLLSSSWILEFGLHVIGGAMGGSAAVDFLGDARFLDREAEAWWTGSACSINRIAKMEAFF